MIDIRAIARALGGEIHNGEVLAPGPGHSATDRSLSVKPDKDAPGGFVVHSFTGDDPIQCKDYVREKLGLPAFKSNKAANSKAWTQIAEYIYRSAAGEPYLRVQKCLDGNGKKQYPQSHWNGQRWVPRKPTGVKIPYHLPELIAAAPTTPIYFCEGEKDADALTKLGFVATTVSEGASAKWDDALTPHFKDRHVVILPDADVPGRRHAQKVAKAINGIAASVRILDLYPEQRDGSDVSDWLQGDRAGVQLITVTKDAPLWAPPAKDKGDGKAKDEVDLVIAEAAALSQIEYEQQREAIAEQLSVRVSILDKLVAKARVDAKDDDDGGGGGDLGGKQADILIALAAQAASLFHTAAGDAYADIVVSDHRETHRIRSKSFRLWLAHQYFQAREGAPNSEAIQSALAVIEARALFEGTEMPVYVRVAGDDGKLYLDLADSQWRAVEIDADGWRVIDSPPVRFRRAPGMLPLPEPISGGSIEALRPLIKTDNRDDPAADDDFVLTVAWLLGALRPRGPYPVFVVVGEHGTAKTTRCELLRALIDPNATLMQALSREDRDLFIAANNSYVLAFDNVSGLPTWISDTLCRLATGGGFRVRQLFSDDAEMLFDATRPIIINGIEDMVTRPDLVDRSIMLTLSPIPEDERRLKEAIYDEFMRQQPHILGALLDVVVHGLRRLPEVHFERLPRMADFALWIAACETAIWPVGTFAAAYEANRESIIPSTIEADLVAGTVCTLMADRTSWDGTATELLNALGALITETQRRSKKWPSLPHHLTGRLRRVAPTLRRIGIKIAFSREATKERARQVSITKDPPPENTGHHSTAPRRFTRSTARLFGCIPNVTAFTVIGRTGEPPTQEATSQGTRPTPRLHVALLEACPDQRSRAHGPSHDARIRQTAPQATRPRKLLGRRRLS
jgi:hypothetical protein